MYINASMGFFWCVKKHLPVISPGISLPSFIQSHTLATASQAVGQRYKSWASKNPTLVQCLVFMCLAIIGLEHCWASFNVKQWWDSDGSLYMYRPTPNQVPAYIAYRACIQNNIHEAFSQC